MSAGRIYTALGIVHYDDKRGRCGNLLGIITFTDGKSLKVWKSTPDLHAQCKEMAQYLAGEVRYSFKRSEKWGDSLSSIARAVPKAEHEVYDEARQRDEQRGRVAPNSWLGHQIAKAVGRR